MPHTSGIKYIWGKKNPNPPCLLCSSPLRYPTVNSVKDSKGPLTKITWLVLFNVAFNDTLFTVKAFVK